MSPKRAGLPAHLRPGDQRITSFFGKVSPQVAATQVVAQAQREKAEDAQRKEKTATDALAIEAAKQQVHAW